MYDIAVESQAQVDEVLTAKNELSDAATDLAAVFQSIPPNGQLFGHGSFGLDWPKASDNSVASGKPTRTVQTSELVFTHGPPLYPEDTSPGPPLYPPREIEATPPRLDTAARLQQFQFRPLWHIVGPRGYGASALDDTDTEVLVGGAEH